MSSPSDDPNDIFAFIGKKLYLTTELADVHFVFKPKNEPIVRVPAHKTLLAAASNVFATMFNGSWKEKNEVQIGDVSITVFKEFLQFFYLDRVQLTKENVSKVMNLGNMYDMGTCMTVCEKFMKRYLNEDNVCEYYGLGILLDRPGLKSTCEDIIGAETKAVLKSASFQTCDKKTMDAILKLDWLSCSEIELFEAVMSWVKTASKTEDLTKSIVQSYLGESFHEFRFGTITFNEFVSLIPSYGKTFSFDEQQEIIQMIPDKNFQSKMFNGKREKRCEMVPWKDKVNVECNRYLSLYLAVVPYFIKNLETTTFSINEAAFLNGFTCPSLHEHDNGKYYYLEEKLLVEITIVTTMSNLANASSDEEIILFKGNAYVDSKKGKVPLLNPILIKPSCMYEIRLKLNPPKNFASGVLMKSEVQMDSDFKVQFHHDSFLERDRNVSRGLICKLDFYRI
ncbi:uncharacterized protein LOC116351261 [Contarinia nasturtii]|uniref:uncharacterized protein LOC116351261 n=1 Tax=Contarinia nasturtii TaxID=265458 RepID=UPI0012D43B8B|nr:uncharacterized protein LOC116351261 [Contarinia nasturtii]